MEIIEEKCECKNLRHRLALGKTFLALASLRGAMHARKMGRI